ncbi:MAG: glycosyltransferase, partial [Planctomycetaceae bacterium]
MSDQPPNAEASRAASSAGAVRTIVIVAAYHADAWLPACVRSLAESWNPHDRLLLIDNSGNSQLESAAKAIPGTYVLATPRPLGFAEANNFGLVQGGVSGDYVCFLNQDTRSGAGWLDACVSCLAARPDVGGVLPLLRTYD